MFPAKFMQDKPPRSRQWRGVRRCRTIGASYQARVYRIGLMRYIRLPAFFNIKKLCIYEKDRHHCDRHVVKYL